MHPITVKSFSLSLQISTSALQIPVRVTRTLNAPTAKGLTAALVIKGLMEMVQLVKVQACRTTTEIICLRLNQAQKRLVLYLKGSKLSFLPYIRF